MKWNLKIKAGALQFVLFIGVVIVILLLTFVTLSHTHTFFGKKSELLIKTIKKTDLGLAKAMENNIVLHDTITLHLDDDSAIEVKGFKSYWGVFEKYKIVSTSKKSKFIKSALVGDGVDLNLPALYLKDLERPMIIAGKAKITGDAYLPKQGIRTGNIAGNSYFQKELVYGNQKISKNELPELDAQLRDYLNNLGKFQEFESEAVIALSNASKINNSFKQATKYILGNVIPISNVQLTGNIVIKASRSIIVSPSAQLKDVILIAPEIIIEDRVHGTFQSIASETISLGKGCQLAYPSALVVYKNNQITSTNQDQKPNLLLKENSTINGVVLYLEKTSEQIFNPQIKIESGVQIIGEVYCEAGLELKGTVTGSVVTSHFLAMENGSIYQNHLYNGQINSPLLNKEYVGLSYKSTSNHKSISKWLY